MCFVHGFITRHNYRAAVAPGGEQDSSTSVCIHSGRLLAHLQPHTHSSLFFNGFGFDYSRQVILSTSEAEEGKMT